MDLCTKKNLIFFPGEPVHNFGEQKYHRGIQCPRILKHSNCLRVNTFTEVTIVAK